MKRLIPTNPGSAAVAAAGASPRPAARGLPAVRGAASSARAVARILAAAAVVFLGGCGPIRSLHLPLLGSDGPYDLVITGGTVVDGTGAPGYRADVAVVGDRIVRISKRSLAHARAARVIDARGRVVAPGFVDLQEHLEDLPRAPDAANMVGQGVTSALGGADGRSPMPLFLTLDTLRRTGTAMNVGYLIGQAAIRRRVMGDSRQPANLAQLDAMRRLVAQAMHDGARGLSADLADPPGRYAPTTEVVALAEVAGDSGGIFAAGLRDTGPGLAGAVAEALEVGRRAGVPVLLARARVIGAPDWGASTRVLAMVDSARAAGRTVWLDRVPTAGTPADITRLVPEWAMQGGRRAFLDRLWRPALRDSIVEGIMSAIVDGPGGNDLRRIELVDVPWQPDLDGTTFHDWAVQHHVDPVPEAAAELVIQAIQMGGARIVLHGQSDDDIARILKDPHTAIVSDGRVMPGTPGAAGTEGATRSRGSASFPVPRDYGAFPRMLGTYVRELHVLSLEEAVHRMTALPAAIAGLDRRGRIAEGWFADLVVFDPATIGSPATAAHPTRSPTGIDWVIVNGKVATRAEQTTGERAGMLLLRRAGARRR